MPWTTPTSSQVRGLVRDFVLAQLGATAMIPNSALRIMSDAKAKLAHLTFLYVDWVAKQMLPDTAETEWLDRHANIWLKNADGSTGRKRATFAEGSATVSGGAGFIIPQFTILTASTTATYQTKEQVTIGSLGTATVQLEALTAGTAGNRLAGDRISFQTPIPGVDATAITVELTGGVEEEDDELLRSRVLFRIQNPPMGGSEADYIRWATSIPGVTRAWAQPFGPGAVLVHFMMDELRSGNRGIPTTEDAASVRAILDKLRPVATMDLFVYPPIPQYYDIVISDLETDSQEVRGRIELAIKDMEYRRAKPGQTMFRSWVDEAISGAVGEQSHELEFDTMPMTDPGNMPFIRTIDYD